MLTQNILTLAAAAMAIPAMAAPQHLDQRTDKPTIVQQLRAADVARDRYKLLKDEDFVFDFKKNPVPLADRQTFPALVGSSGALAYAELPACSMSFIHIHPRSAELFLVTDGKLTVESVPEAGVLDENNKPRIIKNELTAGQMTVFHQGTFHTQLNLQCDNATAVAAFVSEDPGASAVVAQTFLFSDDAINASFGGSIAGEDIDKVRGMIPQTQVHQIEACLKTCGIKKRSA